MWFFLFIAADKAMSEPFFPKLGLVKRRRFRYYRT